MQVRGKLMSTKTLRGELAWKSKTVILLPSPTWGLGGNRLGWTGMACVQ